MKEIRFLEHLKNKIQSRIFRGEWCNQQELDKLWKEFDKVDEKIKELEKEINK